MNGRRGALASMDACCHEHLPQETFDMAAADDAHHRNIEGDQ
jgi:hypothetical protein